MICLALGMTTGVCCPERLGENRRWQNSIGFHPPILKMGDNMINGVIWGTLLLKMTIEIVDLPIEKGDFP